MKRFSFPQDTSRFFAFLAAVVIIAALYFGRVVFIPLALAVLFSVCLTPIVGALERIKLPRALAVFVVVTGVVGLVGFIAWRTSQQALDLTAQLPAYRNTLVAKVHSLKSPSSQTIKQASDTVDEVAKEIASVTPGSSVALENKRVSATPGGSRARPLAVEVVPPSNALESMQNVFGPLATAGVVIVFTIFILLGREDLRNRLIRLAAGNRLNVMTQAIDDATQRVNRYLFLQLLVNTGYGTVVAVGLHFIGLPNVALWGVSAGVLRFLPYVGPPMAALPPIVLALAVFPGWGHAAATAGLFIVLEALVANLLEPLLYGSHVGLSPLAILVAAVFWTLVWGFPGLVLSTPLTACLVAMGRYIPSLHVLSVILGDEPVLSPAAHYYQRLLAGDENEARQVVENSLKDKSLEQVYEEVVIPALGMAETDRHRNELDPESQSFIYQSTREISEELSEPIQNGKTGSSAEPSAEIQTITSMAPKAGARVLCIPARDEADDVVAEILALLAERRGHDAKAVRIDTSAEMLSEVARSKPDVVCISALPPFVLDHARSLYAKLRTQYPDLHVVICLWNLEGNPQKVSKRLRLAPGDGWFATVTQVLQHLELRKKRPAA